MARIRSVKPELATSLVVASWPLGVRYAFVLLWTYLDDKGRGLDIPKRIAGELFPHDDDITPAVMDNWLSIMTTRPGGAGPVCRYEVDGVRYLHTVSSAEHQKPNRPTPSKLPPCPVHEGLTEKGSEGLSESPSGSAVSGGGDGDGEGRKEGEGNPPPPRCPQHVDNSNPPPCGRCKEARLAREAWEARQTERELLQLEEIRQCRLCNSDGYRFIPGRGLLLEPREVCDHRPLRSVS